MLVWLLLDASFLAGPLSKPSGMNYSLKEVLDIMLRTCTLHPCQGAGDLVPVVGELGLGR